MPLSAHTDRLTAPLVAVLMTFAPLCSHRATMSGFGKPQRLFCPLETSAIVGDKALNERHDRRCSTAVVRNRNDIDTRQ